MRLGLTETPAPYSAGPVCASVCVSGGEGEGREGEGGEGDWGETGRIVGLSMSMTPRSEGHHGQKTGELLVNTL